MSYKNSILSRPGEKYPFLLATEADGIPLTRAELETLKFEIDVALKESDPTFGPDDGLPDHKKAGYAERMYEQADMRRKSLRENGQ